MTTKKKKKDQPIPLQSKTKVSSDLSKKQLWIVERTDNKSGEPRKTIYVFADRWFDVRDFAATELRTCGDFDILFISSVLRDILISWPLVENLLGVFEIEHVGSHYNNTNEKQVTKLKLR